MPLSLLVLPLHQIRLALVTLVASVSQTPKGRQAPWVDLSVWSSLSIRIERNYPYSGSTFEREHTGTRRKVLIEQLLESVRLTLFISSYSCASSSAASPQVGFAKSAVTRILSSWQYHPGNDFSSLLFTKSVNFSDMAACALSFAAFAASMMVSRISRSPLPIRPKRLVKLPLKCSLNHWSVLEGLGRPGLLAQSRPDSGRQLRR